MHIPKLYYSQIKNIISLKLLYVLVNMLEIKFRGISSQGHVIHKVNFKVVEKVQRSTVLLFSNLENNDSFGFLVKLPFQQ